MITDWNRIEVERLGRRIDRIERTLRKEKQRSFERRLRVMFSIAWLEIVAIWAISIAKAAGA